MIAVRAEVDKVASGEWDAADNPLKNAPHTAEMLIAEEWAHPYRRDEGGYPGAAAPRPAARPGQVLAPGPPHRPGLRRPSPGLRLPAARGVRVAARRGAGHARRVGPRSPLLHQRGPRPTRGESGGRGERSPWCAAAEEDAAARCRVRRVPAGGAAGEGKAHSPTATGRLSRPARCRGSSITTVSAARSGRIGCAATTAIDGDVAAVHRQVRGARRYVDEVAGPDHRPLGQVRAVPDLGLAADHVDRGLVAVVVVRQAARAGRDHDKVQAERPGARRRPRSPRRGGHRRTG